MNRYLRIAAVAALPVVWAAGCSNFLTSGETQNDPNAPTTATSNQRLLAVSANMAIEQTGDLPRIESMWMQQMLGADRQYSAYYGYDITAEETDPAWVSVYTSGGLIDLRAIEATSRASGDSLYLGIAQVWEAFDIGTAADIWGDVPYSGLTLDGSTSPVGPDAQQSVFDAVEALLSDAITNLNNGQCNSCAGPATFDLVYGAKASSGSSIAKWVQAAHTLKARYYLHQVETKGSSMYTAALAEANLGIAAGNDFKFKMAGTPGEQNLWYQFMQQRDSYIRGNPNFAAILSDPTKANDGRLAYYFTNGSDGYVINAGTVGAANYAWPIITYNENQLIIAEASNQLDDDATALTALINAYNYFMAQRGLTPNAALIAKWTADAGSALFTDIMTEKYIELFGNLEVWNDYKRTCIPVLTPVAGGPIGGGDIPGRFYYGVTENSTNPLIPTVAAQAGNMWNANDPGHCGS